MLRTSLVEMIKENRFADYFVLCRCPDSARSVCKACFKKNASEKKVWCWFSFEVYQV